MSRKQEELPNTRRDDEPKPQKPIKALDDACEVLERAKGKATKAGQAIVEAKAVVDKLLEEHKRDEYEYEGLNGILRKVFRKQSIATCKVKVAKKTDDEGSDGADE